jgi:hypothetical protein
MVFQQKIIKPSQQVYDIVHSATARQDWKNKGEIHADAIDTVHWEVIGLALQTLPKP